MLDLPRESAVRKDFVLRDAQVVTNLQGRRIYDVMPVQSPERVYRKHQSGTSASRCNSTKRL